MGDYFERTPVRIPIRIVGGKMEHYLGGELPLKEGTFGELIVDRSRLTSKRLAEQLTRTFEHLILEEGTGLLVALTVKQPLPDSIGGLLVSLGHSELGTDYFSIPRSGDTRFMPVRIGPPTRRRGQEQHPPKGGVWLALEGTRPKHLFSSGVVLPEAISDKPLDSLNQAFTRLSEVCEPWRTSHTGNVYNRVLYRERNGKWYPLELLRHGAEADAERALLRERWEEIMVSLRCNPPG